MFCKIFIYVHKNLFAPQTWDLLEKLALIFLYNFHHEHGLIKLIRKKLSPKINVKNIKKSSLTNYLTNYIPARIWTVRPSNPVRFAPDQVRPLEFSPQRRFAPGRFAPDRFALVVSPLVDSHQEEKSTSFVEIFVNS